MELRRRLGSRPPRFHGGPVEWVGFAPGGREVISCDGRTVRAWWSASGELLRTFQSEPGVPVRIAGIARAANKLIGVAGERSAVRLVLWDLEDGRLSSTATHASPDSTSLSPVACDDAATRVVLRVDHRLDGRYLTMLDLATGEPCWRERAELAAFRADGSLVAALDGPRLTAIGPDGRLARQWLAAGRITRLAMLGESFLLVRDLDDQLAVLDLRGDAPPVRWKGGPRSFVLGVAAAASGTRVALHMPGAGTDRIEVRNADGTFVEAHDETGVRAIALSDDGRLLARGLQDGHVRVDAVGAPRVPDAPLADGMLPGAIECVAVSPDGGRIGVACADGSLRLWSVSEDGSAVRRLASLEDGHHEPLVVAPDGRVLAACADGRWWLLDPETGAPLRHGRVPAPQTVRSLSLGQEGRHVVVAAARTIHALDVERNAGTRHEIPGDGAPFAIGASPEGSRIAFFDASGLSLWSLGDVSEPLRQHPLAGTRLTPFRYDTSSVRFARRGNRVLISDGRGTAVWDLVENRVHVVSDERPVAAVSLAPSGDRIALVFGDDRERIELRETDSRARLASVLAHDTATQFVTISADGATLVSGGADRTLALWKL